MDAETLTINVSADLSPRQQEWVAEQAWLAHQAKGGGLAPFAKFTMPRYQTPPHILAMALALEEMERGENDRLIIKTPPRHGKSELVSVRYPAYYMLRHPSRSFITASYGEILATPFGRKARNVAMLERAKDLYPGVELAADSKAAGLWTTTAGGTFLSVGIGGAITGFGAHHLNIDDPIRKREEAESAIKRESIYQWYQAEAYTRLEPQGSVSLTYTPWHHDDLGARLIAAEEYGGDKWKVLRFPAIAEEHDELGRKPGEALWPERFSVEQLERIRAAIGEYEWTSLYQLRPTPQAGDIFKWWPRYTKLPDQIDEVLVPLDTAYTKGERSDYTAVAAWARSGKVLHLVAAMRWKEDAPDAEQKVKYFFEMVRQRWPNVPVKLLYKKRVAIDRVAAQHLRAKNIPAVGITLPTKVEIEAMGRMLSVEFEADKMLIPAEAPWLPPWHQEHIDFPNGVHDDWVETTIIAGWYAFRAAPFVRPEKPISIFDRRY